MEKNFSKSEALSLIQSLKAIRENLKQCSYLLPNLKNDVETTIKNAKESSLKETLSQISVDELNRDKCGIKIKTLHDNNYHTIADIVDLSQYRLQIIKGISPEAAALIVSKVRDIKKECVDGAKIKLNLDNKGKAETDLVNAISKYRKLKPLCSNADNFIKKFDSEIQPLIKELEPATGSISWLFSFSSTKDKAIKAYNKLKGFDNTQFSTDIHNTLFDFNEIKKQSALKGWDDFKSDPVAFTNVLEEFQPGLASKPTDSAGELPEQLQKELIAEVPLLSGFKGTLRKYQDWGVRYSLHQKNVLLGDEMGLGKTIQAICVMVSLFNNGGTHFLVVCPAAVMMNWIREVQKMSDLDAMEIHGSDKDQEFLKWQKFGGVAVTTFETTSAILKMSDNFTIDLLVVDEAHYIKNPDAARSKNVSAIAKKTRRNLFMTGTAMENRVEEMINLISVLNPNIANQLKTVTAGFSAPKFRELVIPVYYRRKRSDVLTELPELIDTPAWCKMNDYELKVYKESLVEGNFMKVRRVSWNIDNLEQSSKAQRFKEIVEAAIQEERKVIVFSFFLDTIMKVQQMFASSCMEPINGSVSSQRRQQILDDFNKAAPGSILPAQIISGGTGLNIQCASVVVFCEPQFKPSIENQAIARAYRMGQTRNVLVYRLLCADSVDEKVMKLLEEKQHLFDEFADKSIAAERDREKEQIEVDEQAFGNIIDSERERLGIKAENSSTPKK